MTTWFGRACAPQSPIRAPTRWPSPKGVSTVPSVLSAAGRGVRWVGCAAGTGDHSSGVSAAGDGARSVVSRASTRPGESGGGAGCRLSKAGGGPYSGFRPESCGPRRSLCRAGVSSSTSSATARSGGSRCPGWLRRRPTRSSTAGCRSRWATCSMSSGRGRCISSGVAVGSPPLPGSWSPTSVSWSIPAPGSTGRRYSSTSES